MFLFASFCVSTKLNIIDLLERGKWFKSELRAEAARQKQAGLNLQSLALVDLAGNALSFKARQLFIALSICLVSILSREVTSQTLPPTRRVATNPAKPRLMSFNSP